MKYVMTICLLSLFVIGGCAATGMESKTVAKRTTMQDGTVIEEGVQELKGTAMSGMWATQKEIYARKFDDWEAGLGFQESLVEVSIIKLLLESLAYRRGGE